MSFDPTTLDPLGGRRRAMRSFSGDVVVEDGAFAGLTIEKAEIINDALCGYRVLIVGGQTDHALWSNRGEYMFYEIALPGSRRQTFLSGPYDLVLAGWDVHTGAAGFGATRNISAQLVERFEVVKAPPLSPCWNCARWFPQSELRCRQVGWAGELGFAEDESCLECRGCYGSAL